jgi:hypothetical protein
LNLPPDATREVVAAAPSTVTALTVRPSRSRENCSRGDCLVVAVMVAVAAIVLAAVHAMSRS